MNKIIFFTLVCFFCVKITVFAATERISSNNNNFNGITKVVTYFKKDNYYNKGLKKIVTHYDNKDQKQFIEIYYTNEYFKKVGIYKMLIYNKKQYRVIEMLFTYNQGSKNGYSKLVLYLDKNNKLKKREYYFSINSPIALLGIYKRVIYYSYSGEIIKIIHLDKVGNVAMVE